ncbi:MAG: hypothetical protein ACJAVY_001083 [Marinoscillum sp.]|jgi:hypothetical protein
MGQESNIDKLFKRAFYLIQIAIVLTMLTGGMLAYYYIDPELSAFSEKQEIAVLAVSEDPNKIENGIHVRTGLVEAEGLMTVVNNCTNCHSSKLIIQNRMNAERWNTTIKWMQQTQNLWDLGDNQAVIVNYLVANYPPKAVGRRANLSNIDWYELED